ncbi:unnamed protein product [Pleuronectes platessa]|uniref:Uncharacterized protein n=1 Tax=Pleuronectes platessa TaxID=8262 RepID=A0A9N7UE01_PLEPL|nr:unnamed protein product [Pleuronectes platessa]
MSMSERKRERKPSITCLHTAPVVSASPNIHMQLETRQFVGFKISWCRQRLWQQGPSLEADCYSSRQLLSNRRDNRKSKLKGQITSFRQSPSKMTFHIWQKIKLFARGPLSIRTP